MQKQVTKPATIFLEPISIESNFQKQLIFQIAFYRNDKSKKLDPIKKNHPQKSIPFNVKDSILKLYTTLNHFEISDKIESKMFNIQIAYKIDGVKSVMEKEIDVAIFYRKGDDVHVMKILSKPETELKYRVRIQLKEDKNIKNAENQSQNHNQSQGQGQKENQKEDVLVENCKIQNPAPIYHRTETKSKTCIGDSHNLGTKSLSKPPLNSNKSMKVIRFDDNVKDQKEDDNQAESKQKIKHIRSMKNLEDYSNKHMEEKDGNTSQLNLNKKIQSLSKEIHEKSKEILKTTSKYSQLESKYKELGFKFQKLNQKYSTLVIEKQKLESNNETQSQSVSENELKREKQKYQKLEREYKKLKEQQIQHTKKLQLKQTEIKKLEIEVKSLQQQQKKNESKIKQLKQENQRIEQFQLEIQAKTKTTTGHSLQESLRPYKQRIKLLERQIDDIQQEKKFVEKQSKSRQDQVFQLRQKMKTFNQENLKQIEEITNKQYEIEKLVKKMKDLESELKKTSMKSNKNTDLGPDCEDESDENEGKSYNKFKSEKILGGDNASSVTKLKAQNNELKTKLSIVTKNLQNKEALLKKFDSFSKEGRKEIQEELEYVKKENLKLREKLENGGGKNDLGGLESRMELEKVKKELEYKTKSEKQLLIDKSQLESRNKTLQEDVVKSKESIANILNVIHEFGNEELIEQVNGFLG